MAAATPRPEDPPRGPTFHDEQAMLDELALRDRLTRAQLTAAGARLAGLEVLAFEPDWWDGQAHIPCLVVRGGRRARRQRIVETGGECLVLPFGRRDAERRLAQHRLPRRPELSLPEPRRPDDAVVIDASIDVLRCAGESCGALLPVGYAGGCPVCGTMPEKSTLTGARTAGSSTSK